MSGASRFLQRLRCPRASRNNAPNFLTVEGGSMTEAIGDGILRLIWKLSVTNVFTQNVRIRAFPEAPPYENIS